MKDQLDPLLAQFWGQRFGNVNTANFKDPRPGIEALWQTDCFYSALRDLNEGSFNRWSCGQSLNHQRASNASFGEALERLGSSFAPSGNRLLRGSYNRLKKDHHLFPLEEYFLFSEEQSRLFPQRKDQFRNYRNMGADDQAEWLEGQIFEDGFQKKILFPFSLVTLGPTGGFPYDVPTTNGIALGRSPQMAIENALSEFLERDSFLKCWWHQQSPPHFTGSDLLEVAKGPLRDILQSLKDRITVLDLSEEWGVPVFIALIWGRPEKKESALIVSGACDLDGRKALTKAILETTRIFMDISEQFKQGLLPFVTDPERLYSFKDTMAFYSREEKAKKAHFLLEGPRPGAEGLKRVLKQRSKNGLLVDHVLAQKARMVVFNLTPVDLALGGLHVYRVALPEGIPLNAVHALRPFGCPALRKTPLSQLNPHPHPYA